MSPLWPQTPWFVPGTLSTYLGVFLEYPTSSGNPGEVRGTGTQHTWPFSHGDCPIIRYQGFSKAVAHLRVYESQWRLFANGAANGRLIHCRPLLPLFRSYCQLFILKRNELECYWMAQWDSPPSLGLGPES